MFFHLISMHWTIFIHFWASLPVWLYESCCCSWTRCRHKYKKRRWGTLVEQQRQMEETASEKNNEEETWKTAEMILILAEKMGNTQSFLPLSPQAAQLPQGNHKVHCQTGDKAVFMQQFLQTFCCRKCLWQLKLQLSKKNDRMSWSSCWGQTKL